MPTFHIQCLPAGSVGFNRSASRYAGKCGAYERCKVGGDNVDARGYAVGEEVYWKKGGNEPSGGTSNPSGGGATLTDITLVRSELAQLADVVGALRGAVADLKIVERPDLMRQIPVDKRSPVMKVVAEVLGNLPTMPQVTATENDAAAIFSGAVETTDSAEEAY